MKHVISRVFCLTSCVVVGCTTDPVNIGNDNSGSALAGADGHAPSGDATGGKASGAATGGRPGAERNAGESGSPAAGGSSESPTVGGAGPDGGRTATGGARATGGKPGTGGTTTTAGAPGSGGDTGGAMTTGGTGGAAATGGATTTGGATAGGGDTATGGGTATGGEGGATEPALEPAPGQRILFESAYSNFAWEPRSEGLYVTVDGSAYQYSTPVQQDGDFGGLLNRKDPMTEAEVTAKYASSSELVTTLPESELLAMFALVAEARSGELFVRSCGADGGVVEYVAWLYDPSTSVYSPVLLGTGGDTCVGNSNPAADTIMEWLCSVAGGTDCNMSVSVDCAGATCSDEPPTCPGMNRPSVVDGCWDDCVPNTWCNEAPSCDDCTEYQVCVITSDGKSHCSEAGCRYEDCPSSFSCGISQSIEVTCDCAGAELCSGGRAWCHQLGPAKFSCEAP